MKKNLILSGLFFLALSNFTAVARENVPDFDVRYATTNYQASGSVGALTNRASSAWLGNLRGKDTWRDLIVANDADNTVSIRLCLDNGTFGGLTNYPVGLNPKGIRSGKLNGDVFEDIVVANSGTNTISVLHNLGLGLFFSSAQDFVVGTTANPGPVGVSIIDINGDGTNDISVVNSLENNVSILLQTNGVFTVSTNYDVGSNPQSLAIVDLNADGRRDILTANQDDGTLTILPKQVDGTFGAAQTITLFVGGDPQPVHALTGDVNADGIIDIVTANYASNSVSVLLGTGGGAFTMATNYNVDAGPRSLLLRDLNSDGSLDIVVACQTDDTINALLNLGDGSFEAGYDFAVGSSPVAVVGSNFGSDRFTDLAVANNGDNTIGILVYDLPRIYSDSKSVLEDTNSVVTVTSLIHPGRTATYTVVSEPINGVLTGSGPAYTYTPDTNYFGPDSFTFRVNDGTADSPEATMTLNVVGVNDRPSFVLSTNAVHLVKYGALNVFSNFVSSSSTGPANESGQTLSYIITVTNAGFYAVKPTITAAGTLSFKASASANGTNVISVFVRDSGNTLNGGVRQSIATNLSIIVPPNPYLNVKGIYSGLFYESTAVGNDSSGWFTFNVNTLGAFTGQLKLGRAYALRGHLNADGQAQSTINRLVGPPLTVNLSVNTVTGSDVVTGTVSDGAWTADLAGDRLVYHITTNPAPQLGLYTMVIPGSNDPALSPAGSGYATIRVDAAGRIRMAGLLADGKSIAQTTFVSKNGQWPLYVPVYATKGSIISWLTFTNEFNSSLAGNLSWIKTGAAGGNHYPLGFTNEAYTSGSTYTVMPTGQRTLEITNGLVLLSGGNLASPLVNTVLFKTNNTATTISGTATNLTLKVATNGVVTGSFKRPNGTTSAIKGVVLQQQNTAGGFFLGTNQSGAFLLQAN